MIYSLYDASGAFVHLVDADTDAFAKLNIPAGGGFVAGAYPGPAYYANNGQPTPRPASPISRSGLTLRNVPTGATLTIDGTHYSAQGTVSLNFPLPGTYALRVECFPYLDWTDEVTV